MRKTLLSLGLAASISGCLEFDGLLAPQDLDFGGWGGCITYCDIDFLVIPPGTNLLTGDTLRLRVLSTMGNDAATWASSSDAVSFIASSGFVSEVSPAVTTVLLKARHTGVADIRVRAIDTTYKQEIRFHVADSSTITRIALTSVPPEIPVGAYFQPEAHLLNAAGHPFHGTPTNWTSSNPDVLTLERLQSGIGFRALKAGSAVITATFLTVSQTVTVRVGGG
jgi:hypothetical protein